MIKIVLIVINLFSIAGCGNYAETKVILDERTPLNKLALKVNIQKPITIDRNPSDYSQLKIAIDRNLQDNGFLISEKEARLTGIISYSIKKMKKPAYLKSLQTHDEEGNEHTRIFQDKKLYSKKSLILKIFKKPFYFFVKLEKWFF